MSAGTASESKSVPLTDEQSAIIPVRRHAHEGGGEPHGQPSRLDRWWGRMLATAARRNLWYWGGPVAVTVLAGILRFWNLGHPHALYFDERYYVKDAWTLLHLGYEAQWPDGADAAFIAGDGSGFLDTASFVVHPPLGKWIIAIGMAMFGAGDAFGWRVTTAVLGTLAVLLLTLVARALLRSTAVAVIVGSLFAIDGNAIVMARIAILDNSVMILVLAGFACVLADRHWHAARLGRALDEARRRGREPTWGPTLWWRPWVLSAGVAFGLASAVKWSGFYVLAVFGIYLVVVDALARRRAGVPFWFTAAFLKQGPVTFVLFVPIAALAHLVTWTGWFVTGGGYSRDWAQQPGNAATGFWSWLPLDWQSFWHYQEAVYSYHVNEDSEHPYRSPAWSWLLMIRPTSMYWSGGDDAGACGADACAEAITGLGNPLIWWAAAAAVIYLAYRFVRYRQWQAGLVLTGLAATYLPWLLYPERTMYQFYSIAFQPYTMLALGFAISAILGTRGDPSWRRERGVGIVAAFLLITVLVSAFFFPLWTGTAVPFWFWQAHIWLPTWR